MTIGVFYVNVNNLHDRSFNTPPKIDIKNAVIILIRIWGKSKRCLLNELRQINSL
jgi:hypothetical protein